MANWPIPMMIYQKQVSRTTSIETARLFWAKKPLTKELCPKLNFVPRTVEKAFVPLTGWRGLKGRMVGGNLRKDSPPQVYVCILLDEALHSAVFNTTIGVWDPIIYPSILFSHCSQTRSMFQ